MKTRIVGAAVVALVLGAEAFAPVYWEEVEVTLHEGIQTAPWGCNGRLVRLEARLHENAARVEEPDGRISAYWSVVSIVPLDYTGCDDPNDSLISWRDTATFISPATLPMTWTYRVRRGL